MRSSPLSLLLALGTSVSAQDIVVTGRGLTDPIGDAAYSIVEVPRDRLTGTASGRLEDALRAVAGLQQFRRSDARSANPTSQGATLRGLGGNAASRVLVLRDGVPQGDPFAGYVSWPLYLPETIGRVRVTRGGGSGAGGAGALAGTIEINSITAGEADGLTMSLAGGSYGSVEARALLAAPLASGFGFVSGGYARGDGFVPIVTPGRADTGARYDQANLSARAVVPLGGGEMQGNIDLFDDIRTRGTAFSRNRTTGGDFSLRWIGSRLLVLGYVQLRRFTSQFASVDAARTTATQTLDQFNTPATGLGLKIEVRPALGEAEARLGAEWRRTSGETNEAFSFVAGAPTRLRRAGGSADVVGVFAEASRAGGPVTLTGGARVDRWSLTDGTLSERRVTGEPLSGTRFAHRQDWQATGRAGIAAALSPALSARGAAYLGWRLPTLNELYRPFRVGTDVTAPNAALRPERSRGIEASLGFAPAGGFDVSLTAFAVRVSDPIANITLSSGPGGTQRARRNLDRLDARGVEVDASLRRQDWRGALSVSYTDATIDGLRPASVAPLQAAATLGWRRLAATLRYTSAQFDDDQNTRRLAPAITLDAVGEVPISPGVALRLRGENVFDTRVEAAVNAAGLVERAGPRTIWIGVKIVR